MKTHLLSVLCAAALTLVISCSGKEDKTEKQKPEDKAETVQTAPQPAPKFPMAGTVKLENAEIGMGWASNSVNAPIFRKNSVTSYMGTQYAAYYDTEGYLILAKRSLDSLEWEVKQTELKGNIRDAHRSISLGLDGDGYLHVSWDHHDNSLHYARSSGPGSLELEKMDGMLGRDEKKVSYPEFYRMPDGNLLFLYRNGESGRGNMLMNLYLTESKKWTRLHDILIDGEDIRNAYWQCCVSDDGTIHVSWVWRETWDVSTNHDICYARSIDGGMTWTNSRDEEYKLPIKQSDAEIAALVPQDRELINQTSMYADSDGNPYIVSYWTPEGSSVPQYHLVYNNGKEWKVSQISNRTGSFSLSGGGTKKIPISRPQILIDESGDKARAYMIYRDQDRHSQVSVNLCYDLDSEPLEWGVYDLTDYSVRSWEPSYDTDLWKERHILDLFVQAVGQGDGEGLEEIGAQPVGILRALEWGDSEEKFSF